MSSIPLMWEGSTMVLDLGILKPVEEDTFVPLITFKTDEEFERSLVDLALEMQTHLLVLRFIYDSGENGKCAYQIPFYGYIPCDLDALGDSTNVTIFDIDGIGVVGYVKNEETNKWSFGYVITHLS